MNAGNLIMLDVKATALAKLMKGVMPLSKIQRIAKEEFSTIAPVPNDLVLPYSVASVIVDKHAATHGFKAQLADVDLKRTLLESAEVRAKLPPRSPIVTVMGHVDHGKTTLLDALRGANTAALEAGGITQAVTAFQVPFGQRSLTFLDTPGHGAFHIMRETGSGVADVVLLVVALDEGVKPQTKESVGLALNARTPVLAAINKVDLGGDVKKLRASIKRLVPAPLLLDTVEVSAKLKRNMDGLRAAIVSASDKLDPRADARAAVEGTVIEAVVDKSLGHVIRAVLHRGTLSIGQHLLAGLESGRVRALFSDAGKPLKEAKAGEPVQIVGLSGIPLPGEAFFGIARERIEAVVEYRKLVMQYQEQQAWAEQELQHEQVRVATRILDTRSPGAKKEEHKLKKKRREGQQQPLTGRFGGDKQAAASDNDADVATEEDGYEEDDEGAGIRVPVVIKAGNVGALVMLLDSLHKMSDVDVTVAVVQASVGGLKPRDITHAEAEGGECPILCFDTPVSKELLAEAKATGVDVKLYSVVFDLLDDVRARIMQKVKAYEDADDDAP